MGRRRRGLLLGGVSVAPTLPAVLGTPYFAVGMTKLVTGYAGSAYQGQNSGATTTDIGFKANGVADESAATSAGVVTGKIWYDQSGNGRNWTNDGVNARPIVDPSFGIYNTMTMMFGAVDNAAPPTQNLQSANTLSMSTQNFTLYLVMNPVSSYKDSTLYEFRTGGGNTMNSYTEATAAGIKSFGSGSVNTTLHPRAQMSVIAITHGAAGRSYYYRGQKTDLSAASLSTCDQLVIGNSSFGAAYNSKGHYAAIVGYATEHNSTQVAQVTAVLESAYGAASSFTSRIVSSGDSIARGLGVLKSYTTLLQISGAEIFNIGVDSKTMASIYADRAIQEGALYTASYGAGKCYVIQEGGINDIATSGVATGAALYTIRSDYETYCKGLGYKTIHANLIDCTGLTAPQIVVRDAFNVLVDANSIGANAIADVKTTLTLGGPDYIDGVHPTTLGHGKIAPIYKSAVQSA